MTDGITKRFFQAIDGSASWFVVASDMDHAKLVLKEQGVDFDLDFDDLNWVEMTPGQVEKKQRCATDDERGTIRLSEANLGEWFCTEW